MKPLLTFVSCLFFPLVALGGDEPAKPNIVFIISDDHAWTDYGFMGHPHIETPHLDTLATRSAVFTRGYVPTALCRPALATFATGLYAHQHRTSGNDPAQLPSATAPEVTKLKLKAKAKPNRGDSAEYAALRERLISHIDQHPTIARLLGQQRLPEPSVGQVVGRQLPAGRLHARHDARLSAARRAPRGRRLEDRPRGHAAGVRVHRSCHGRAETVLPLVRAVHAP